MDKNQLVVFESWLERDLHDGALSFEFPEPGDTGRTLIVAFAQPPSWSNEATVWHVRMELNVERRELTPEERQAEADAYNTQP